MRTRMLDMKRIIYYAQRVAAARGDEPRTVLQELEAECAAMPKSVSSSLIRMLASHLTKMSPAH